MKQIIQDIKSGKTILEEVPQPQIKSGTVLIRTTRSLVSLGTEKMLVEFGRANIIEKARQQPDRVKEVLEKIKTDGLIPTLDAVFNKLNQPIPLGYCNVGVVEQVGKGVYGIHTGDRVVSNGGHAEFVCVPENLTAKIPDNVSDEDATFTVIGSIGLQGIRLCNPTLGETIVVIGLGLIGLVTAQLLKANGCVVIGYDYDQQKVDLAASNGIIAFNPSAGNDPVKFIRSKTNDIGADGVIITASNKDNEIIHQAAEMSRKKGRIVLIGVIGLNINRSDFYEKELSFIVSCSYGPGRYDENYERNGQDYPISYIRWTEKRNFEAVLQCLSSGLLKVEPFITEKVALENFDLIYGNIGKKGAIASILEYPDSKEKLISIHLDEKSYAGKKGVFGVIGAGNFTSATIIPSMKSTGAFLKYIASAGGLTAKTLAKRGNISIATSDYQVILNDQEVDTVIISTRHNLHAKMVIESLNAGKNVFVEKPLCLTSDELDAIRESKVSHPDLQLVVGFNRRFSPIANKMRALAGDGPKNIVATMNAGFIPKSSWVHQMDVGGGRIIGEACHFIDLCTFFARSKVKEVCMTSLGLNYIENTDNATILLRYENGSNAVINYFSNGSKSYSKERVEIYCQEKTIINDNWRVLKGYGTKGFSTYKSRINKGHKEQFKLLTESVMAGRSIIPFDEIENTTRATFAALKSLKEGTWIKI